MSKGLDALKEYSNNALLDYSSDYYLSTKYIDDYQTIEKELKVLEIIKNKLVDIEIFIYHINSDVEIYNLAMDKLKERYLTQEEYDLLREELL